MIFIPQQFCLAHAINDWEAVMGPGYGSLAIYGFTIEYGFEVIGERTRPDSDGRNTAMGAQTVLVDRGEVHCKD